ncbi:MAG: alpha/beta hydrolase [SAR324 cluster bacterium]|nr:alpha/beta hydrolase [SAR324 cluster bacterium]
MVFRTNPTTNNNRTFRRVQVGATNLLSRGAFALNPKWTGRAVHKKFFTPQRFYSKPKHQNILEKANLVTLDYQGRPIKLWSWGQGEKVLMVHGWSGRGAQFYALIEALILVGLQPVTFDQPAHGDQKGVTNLFEFIEATEFVAQELGGLKAVVGHSMGTVPSLQLAQKFGLKTVLFAPGMNLRQPIENVARGFGLHAGIVKQLLNDLETKHGKSIDDVSPEVILGKITTPVLIMHDEGDKYAPAKASAAVSANLEHVKYHQTKNLGHSKILEDPALVQMALDYILED